jgi:SAM-dependent methyltransferase
VTAVNAPERRGLEIADCVFFHSMDLPRSGRQTGVWELVGRFEDYIGHQELAGRTVLDVGAMTGFLTFEAEKRGATATAFDATSAALWRELPIPGTRFTEDHDVWLRDADEWFDRVKNSFWLSREELGSSARCMYGNIYDLGGEAYDVVIVGQVLVHLNDALSALAAAASVCAETLVVVEGNLPGDEPIAGLCARVGSPITPAWYHYSHGWYREVLAMLGFRDVAITTGHYRCNDPLHPREIELATVVASR